MTPADPLKSPLDAASHADPYPYYAGLVAQRPLYFDAALGCWVAAGAAIVSQLLEHPACKVRPAGEPVPATLLGTQAGTLFGHLVRMNDGPPHTRLKAVVGAALDSITGPTLEAVAREAARQTAQLTSPTRPGPGLTDYGYQVSMQALGLLLGIAPAELATTARLTSLAVRCIVPGATADQVAAGREAAALLWQQFDRLLAQPAPASGHDLLWALQRRAAAAGGEVGRDAVLANAIGFLTQGFEATSGLIGNALLALGGFDAARVRAAVAPPAMTAFLREVLRHDSPIQNTRRFAIGPVELGGQRIEAGQSVLLLLAAANRDPACNPASDLFDPARQGAALFSFSRAAHQCPGQRLAEAFAAAAIDELLGRGLDPRRLARPVQYRRSVNARVPELQLAA